MTDNGIRRRIGKPVCHRTARGIKLGKIISGLWEQFETIFAGSVAIIKCPKFVTGKRKKPVCTRLF